MKHRWFARATLVLIVIAGALPVGVANQGQNGPVWADVPTWHQASQCWQSSTDVHGYYAACCHHLWIPAGPHGTPFLQDGPLGCDATIREGSCPNTC